MKRRWTNPTRGMLFAWGMLLGLIFLFSPKGLAGQLQLTYARVFRWPLAAGRVATLAARTGPETGTDGSRDRARLQKDYQRLQNENANLRAQLQEMLRANEQLAKLRLRTEWESMGLRPAAVVAPADETETELIINRGRDDQVAVGQFVMSVADQSIIGTISAVSSRGAKVKLITDPASTMQVTVGSLHVPGLLVGHGDGTARIPLISTEHEIRAGDPVYAEKCQGLLDVAIIAGQVASCRRDASRPLLWEITVRPVCDVRTIDEVCVLQCGAAVP